MEQYMCRHLLISNKVAEKIRYMENFYPKMFELPTIGVADMTIHSAQTLFQTLQAPHQYFPLQMI